MEVKLDYMHCALCGRPFPILNAMTVSSLTYPGFFEHYPNCEYYVEEVGEWGPKDDPHDTWEDEGGQINDSGT